MTKQTISTGANLSITFDEAADIVSTFGKLTFLMQKYDLLSNTDRGALGAIEERTMNKLIKRRPKFIDELWKASSK